MTEKEKVVVIGSGFSGLAAATVLADAGKDVLVVEKNDTLGGRARSFSTDGFTFDMGPSWYWMPEVFENYFNRFDKTVSDYYELIRLNPSYRVYFQNEYKDVPANIDELYQLFEELEPGSSGNLKKFLKDAQYKYEVGMNEFVWKPSHSLMEFADLRILKSAFKLQLFSNISNEIRKLFKHPFLVKILEFPVLFLGATAQNTPALYSLMNYADLELGTWYPKGGMFKIIEGMVALAKEKGVRFETSANIISVDTVGSKVVAVNTKTTKYECDFCVASGDYHHIDQNVLPKSLRNYTEEYWDKRDMAPSSLLFYIGLDKKIEGIKHHSLFFDEELDVHADEIYENPKWPSKPLFYVCAPSVTDTTVAPIGQENIFLLMPIAPDLEDNDEIREKYFDIICDRLKDRWGTDIRDHIVYKRSYCLNDFKEDYYAYKGNAYGLANTLMQTAFLKPKLKNKHLDNFFYTGQLTTPGPGVPPSLISGQVVASEILKN